MRERTAEEIAEQIEKARQRLVEDVRALERHLREKVDPRARVRAKPLSSIGMAFAVGLVLGLI